MIKFFILPQFEKMTHFIFFKEKSDVSTGKLFQSVDLDAFSSSYVKVDEPVAADFIVIPHNFFYIENKVEYINRCIAVAASVQKKLLIFAYGDSDKDILVPNSIVVRTSQYRYKKKDTEIIMPAYVEDLGVSGLLYRSKETLKPVVSFVGWAGFSTFFTQIKYFIKVASIDIRSWIGFGYRVKKPGIYFRRKALKILRKSHEIDTSFVIRQSYSGHVRTIETDPLVARKDFCSRISNSDFALAVKGDGNYSLRFFEILSLGRIPLLLDTECMLPFEDILKYDEFILRVPYNKVDIMDKKVVECYTNLTQEGFISMQKKARSAFEDYLAPEAFFRRLCDRLEVISHEK